MDIRNLLEGIKETIRHGDFSTGWCCCGSPVDSHTFGDGHSPVDEGYHYIDNLLARIDTAISGMEEK